MLAVAEERRPAGLKLNDRLDTKKHERGKDQVSERCIHLCYVQKFYSQVTATAPGLNEYSQCLILEVESKYAAYLYTQTDRQTDMEHS